MKRKMMIFLLISASLFTIAHAQDAPPVIGPDNIQNLTEVQRIGDGFLSSHLTWTDDYLAVGGSLGIWFYDDPQDFQNEPPRLLELPDLSDFTATNASFGGPYVAVEDRENLRFQPPDVSYLADVETGEIITTYAPSRDIALSPAGHFLAHIDTDQSQVILHDLESDTSEPIPFEGWGSHPYLEFTPDGKYLVIGARSVIVWDVIEHQKLVEFQTEEGDGSRTPFHDFAFSADGQLMVAGKGYISDIGSDPNLYVRELSTGAIVGVLEEAGYDSPGVAFSPDGNIIASASWDGVTRIWDATTFEQITTLPPASNSVAFSPDGQFLAATTRTSELKIWDTATWDDVSPAQHFTKRASSFDQHGDLLATADSDRIIRLYDLSDGSLLAELTEPLLSPFGWGYAVQFSPDGQLLAAGGDEGRLWDVASFEEQPLETHLSYFFQFISNDQVLSPSSGASGSHLFMVNLSDDSSSSAGFSIAEESIFVSPGGRYWMTFEHTARASTYAHPSVWDTTTDETVFYEEYTSGRVAITTDDSMMAVSRLSGIELYHLPDFTLIGEIAQSESEMRIQQMIFSPDGRLLLALDDKRDAIIRVWDTTSLTELDPIPQQPLHMTFSDDGAQLITSGMDGTVRIWGITSEE